MSVYLLDDPLSVPSRFSGVTIVMVLTRNNAGSPLTGRNYPRLIHAIRGQIGSRISRHRGSGLEIPREIDFLLNLLHRLQQIYFVRWTQRSQKMEGVF